MKPSGPAWSLNLFSVSGIPIRLHLSFFLLIAWILFQESGVGGTPVANLLLILAVFVCVLLHELGHALTAQRFNIPTRDIVLYPFGGIANLMAEARPKAELIIAAAGPLVNVVIAAILYSFVDFSTFSDRSPLRYPGFIEHLFIINVGLVVFNLIPAWPMDGGRILRSTLALFNVQRATTISARVSQVLSLALGLYALYMSHPFTMIIAVLIFSSASRELLREKTKYASVGLLVSDVMTRAENLQSLTHGMTISQALDVALRSLQPLFPVKHADQVLGIVERNSLLETAALDRDEHYLSDIMHREFAAVSPETPLNDLAEILQSSGTSAMPVIDVQGSFQGIVLKEKLMEYLLVHEFRKRARAQEPDSGQDEFIP